MGGGVGEEGLRRRMPLRRAGGGGGVAASASTIGCRAMRYYRLWIYTCNTALLAGALAFMGAAARTLVFDYRRSLIPSLSLYQPSFLYGYLALITQGGALQFLGCVAAIRLSERLLNAYWMVLLVLLFGDVLIGAFWAFRFERVCQELRPALKVKWIQEYGLNLEFTALWDRLQSDTSCCGPTGPSDYNQSKSLEIPLSCCREITVTNGNGHGAGGQNGSAGTVGATTTSTQYVTYRTSCEERLQSYLRSTASLLAILGYCVLAFLKLCFLGILRYEIREMIQKIRILRSELELPSLNGAVPGVSVAGLRSETGNDSERESLLLVRPDSAALLSSPPPTTQTTATSTASSKNPNGNNNYEMREYKRNSRQDTNI